jgi:hypothetical protein
LFAENYVGFNLYKKIIFNMKCGLKYEIYWEPLRHVLCQKEQRNVVRLHTQKSETRNVAVQIRVYTFTLFGIFVVGIIISCTVRLNSNP